MPSYGDLAVSPALPPNLPGPRCPHTGKVTMGHYKQSPFHSLPFPILSKYSNMFSSSAKGKQTSVLQTNGKREFAYVSSIIAQLGGGIRTGTSPRCHQNSWQRRSTQTPYSGDTVADGNEQHILCPLLSSQQQRQKSDQGALKVFSGTRSDKTQPFK